MDPYIQNIVAIVTAVSAALAAGFSAWSAWVSSKSAKAAQEGVEEARSSRKLELRPRLVLERDFLDFEFLWPHPNSVNGEPVFLSRKNGNDKSPTPPNFSLTNHGTNPALEISIVFEFEDPNGPLDVPFEFAKLGLSVDDEPPGPDQDGFKILNYQLPSGKGVGLPLYYRWTTNLPNCAPGQTRTIDFPQSLLNRLLLRGLQQWTKRGTAAPSKALTLVVVIECYTIEGDEYETQFRFEAFPFWQGEKNPLQVVGHFSELPMFPKKNAKRVA